MAVKKELVAPCGIYCAICPLFLAQEDEALAKSMAARMNTTPDKAVCAGCRPTKGSPLPLRGKICPTYSCAEEKGHFVCSECAGFACNYLAPSADRADVLPHNTKIFNLLLIKREGLDRYAEKVGEVSRRYFNGKMVIGHGPVLEDD